MAKQLGILPIQGAIDNIQFFKAKDGSFRVRKKTSIDKNVVATDPQFERTREIMADFSTAMKVGKLIREGLKKLVERLSDPNMSRRLASGLFKAIKADAVNDRGKKTIMDGNISLLTGFEFSGTGVVSTTFKEVYSTTVDRATGKLIVQLPAFVPKEVIAAPQEATHFQLHAAALELSLATPKTADIQSTAKLPLDNNSVNATSLEALVTPNSPNPLLLVFGIEFWIQDVNQTFYAIKNRVYNGAVIAQASKP